MTNRTIILVLSAVLIAAVVSGCVQEVSEIETPQSNVTPPATTPDAAPQASEPGGMTASASVPPELANWNYVSYRNLSISNAPALNQTARITYSIIPGRDLEVLSVGITVPAGFIFVDADKAAHQVEPNTQMVFRNASLWRPIDLSQKNTCLFDEVTLRRRFKPPDKSYYSAFWYTTNLSKDEIYQFTATIKSVKTGNWRIHTYDEDIYISVSEDSAYIRDTPFPDPYRRGTHVLTKSEFEKMYANVSPERRPTFPSGEPPVIPVMRPKPFPANYHKIKNMTELETAITKTVLANPTRQFAYWNGTAWAIVAPLPKNMTNPLWNGTTWVERKNQS